MSQVVRAVCPGCGKPVQVPAEWVGSTLRCKACGQVVRAVPRRTAAAAPAPPPAPGTAAPQPYTPPLTPGEPFTPPGPVFGDAAFTPAFLPEVNTNSKRPYRRPGQRGRRAVWLFGLALLALAGVATAAVLHRAGVVDLPLGRIGLGGPDDPPHEVAPAAGAQPRENPSPPFAAGAFPRRLLSINLSHYLYANPIHPGKPFGLRNAYPMDTHAVVTKLSERWRIPKDQVFELSDSLEGGAAVAPLKGVIEEALQKFLETSRPQDRLVILFTGHAAEIGGEAYLVPLEGELDEPETLIPLKEVYDRLARCPAQEKLVIFDVCRYNPGRGQERAGGGPMSTALEKALHSPPPGVRVWTSCSAGQSSYEYEFEQVGGYEFWGSAFLGSFFFASQQGKLGGGIQSPDEPLPIEKLAEAVNARTAEVIRALENKPQTPKLTGAPPETQVAYDPDAPPAASFAIPRPPPGADRAEIAAVMEEIRVPPIKIARRGERPIPIEDFFPFPADVMAEYRSDGVPYEEILRNPDRYPVREITLRAVELLRDLRAAGGEAGEETDDLPEEFRSMAGEATAGEAVKKQVLAIQRVPATQMMLFRELLAEMDRVAEHFREAEPSKRWRANFDYVRAQVMARYAYLSEYNLMLGKVRKDELPPLENGQSGWRLASVEKLSSPREVRDVADQSREILEALVEEHPNTPWAVLAKRQQSAALGLQWQPASFGGR